jgi:hypothetical protein
LEPLAQAGLSSDSLAQQVYDSNELALLEKPSPSTEALVLTFNESFQPAALLGNTLGFDVQLTDSNGDPVVDPTATAPPELLFDPNAASSTQLVIPLIQGDSQDQWTPVTLQPGMYQVSMEAGSALAATLGADPDPGWAFENQPLAQFSVLGQGAMVSGATNLGSLGAKVQTIQGTLTPADYRNAVDLYEFTIAPGSIRQFGVQVSTPGGAGSLLPALTIFDSQGKVLATRDSGTGLPSDPNDPYLLLGLQPGTYYAGISGAGNLPTVAGGYNPVTGTPGIVGRNQPGGPFPFQLSLVAAPHNPSSLTGFSLTYADPLDPSPTGLTLTFSGPIDPSGLLAPDQQESALLLLDSSGKSWPMTALSYQVSENRLTMLFDQRLSGGSYTLVSPANGGLTDLAGLPVGTPKGLPPGVLARWTVVPQLPVGPIPSQNLGVLWPGQVNVTWNPVTDARTTGLAPGQASSYRFVVTCPGIYEVESEVGEMSVQLYGSAGTPLLNAGMAGPGAPYVMDITAAGVYSLHFTSVGSQQAQVQWVLKPLGLDYEKLLDNGVGQAFALGLELSSAPAYGPVATPGSPAPVVAPPSPSPNPAPDSQTAFVVAASGGSVAASPIPTSLLVTLNSSVLGLPSPDAQNVSPVGPTAPGGSIALADNGAGLLPGIRYQTSPGAPTDVSDRGLLGATSTPRSGDIVPGELAAHGTDPDALSVRADAQALATGDLLVRLAGWLRDGLATSSRHDAAVPTDRGELVASRMDQDPVPARLLRRAGSAATGGSPSLVQADLGAPVSLIVGAAVAYRLRQPLLDWWRRDDQTQAGWGRPLRAFARGPHFRWSRARTRRVRKPASLA